MDKRNHIIDAMRFFAAATVAFFHYSQPIPHVENWYRNAVKYGWIGVPVFFMISGYCIMASAWYAAGAPQFLIKRFFRIFPAYWLSLLIVLAAAVFEKLYTGYNSVPNLPANWRAFLASLTLTTSPLTNIKTANWVYWTLTYEICFYLVTAVFVLLKRTGGFIWLLAVTAAAAIPQSAHYLFFLDSWMVFCLGICIFLAFHYNGRHKTLYLILLTGCCAYSFFSHHQEGLPYLGAAAFTAITLILSHYYRSGSNLLSVLGEYSYGIYLIHVPVGIFMLGIFKTPYIQQHVAANIAYDVLVFALTCALSALVFRLVEAPAQKTGKKLSERLFKRSPSTASSI